VELPEHGGGVADLVQSLDAQRRDQLAVAVEALERGVRGEGWRGEDGRVGGPETREHVDLLECVLHD
jgi:hypothetical protein